jgi:hypothetical protein
MIPCPIAYPFSGRRERKAMATEGDMSSVNSTAPQSLGRVLVESAAAQSAWRADELSAIWRHQLSVPLAFDLGGVEGEQWPELAGGRLTWAVTFGELLQQSNPPIEMLRCVKQFAKGCRQGATAALPPEVATVLYFSSIVAARLHAGQTISDLDEPQLRTGLEWALSQPWIEEQTRGLIQAGLESVKTEQQNPEGQPSDAEEST